MDTHIKKISIVIVDDHTLMRETLASALSKNNRFSIVGKCGNGKDFVKLAWQLIPDVILIDIGLPESNGIKIISAIKEIAPWSKIVGISQYSYTEYARKIIQAGALGYITKRSTLQETEEAILAVQGGEKYVCSEIRNRLADEWMHNKIRPVDMDLLTSREKEIIMFIHKGCSSKEISETLHLSLRTVETYRSKILKKLKAKNFSSVMHIIKGPGVEKDVFIQ